MTIPMYTLPEQRVSLDDEEEENLAETQRRALESLATADLGLPTAAPMQRATDVMAEATGEAPADMSTDAWERITRGRHPAPVTVRGPGDPAAAREAQRIADTDPAEWARQRAATPATRPRPATPAALAGSTPTEIRPEQVRPRELAEQVREAKQEAPADVTDPALSDAVAESRRSRILRALLALGGAAVSGRATGQRVQQVMGDPDAPLKRYAQQRAMLDRQEDRSLAHDQQRAAQERQAALDAQRQEQAALDRDLAQQRLGLQERQVDQRGAADARRAELDAARLGLLEAQRAAEEGDAQSQAAMRDPSSDLSRGTQDLYIDMIRESRGGDVPPAVEAAVRSQPAHVLMQNDALRTSIQGGYSVRRSRRGGGSGGAGLGSRGRGATQALRHYQQALDVTGDPAAAAASTEAAFPGFEAPGGGQGEQLSPRQRSEAARWAQMNVSAQIPEILPMVTAADAALRGASDGDIREAVAIINGGTFTREVLRSASPKAAALAQAVMQLSNVELRRVSGAAVSDQEFDRFKQGIGTNSLSPELLRMGVRAIRRNTDSVIQQIDAGFPGLERYIQGQRQEQRGGGRRSQGGGSRVRVRYGGRVLEIPRSRLEAAQRDGAELVEEGR